MCVKFQLSVSHSSRDIKESQILWWGVKFSLKLVPHFGVKVDALLGLTEEGPSKAEIVDVKFRCKIIRHLMSNSVSKMPIFEGFLGDFSVGVEIYWLLGVRY